MWNSSSSGTMFSEGYLSKLWWSHFNNANYQILFTRVQRASVCSRSRENERNWKKMSSNESRLRRKIWQFSDPLQTAFLRLWRRKKSIDWPKKLETSIVQPSDRKIVLDFRKKQMHWTRLERDSLRWANTKVWRVILFFRATQQEMDPAARKKLPHFKSLHRTHNRRCPPQERSKGYDGWCLKVAVLFLHMFQEQAIQWLFTASIDLFQSIKGPFHFCLLGILLLCSTLLGQEIFGVHSFLWLKGQVKNDNKRFFGFTDISSFPSWSH